MITSAQIGEGIFWFGLVGAAAAAGKHLFAAEASLRALTPAAFDGAGRLSAAGRWWGGAAFGAMNLGFAAVGGHAAWVGSDAAKRGFLLATATLFGAFAAAWFSLGPITGNSAYKTQGAKILALGVVFLLGFLLK